MKILLLEDRGSVSLSLENNLKKTNKIFPAFSIYDANDKFNKNDIDCIILDLNLDPNGLSDKDKEETNYGVITGWVWFERYVLKKYPNFKKRVIIYSDYIEQLDESKFLSHNSVMKIPKKGVQFEKIIEAVNDLSKINFRKKNVLLIGEELNTEYFNIIKQKLKDKGVWFFEAKSVKEAQQNIENNIDLIILELPFNTEGLTDKEKLQSQNGQSTGRVWLREYIKPNPVFSIINIILLVSDVIGIKNEKLLNDFPSMTILPHDKFDIIKIENLLE